MGVKLVIVSQPKRQLAELALSICQDEDPIHVWRGLAIPLGLPAKEGVNAPVPVGRQISNQRLDRGQQLGVGRRGTPSADATALTGRPPATRSRPRAAFWGR